MPQFPALVESQKEKQAGLETHMSFLFLHFQLTTESKKK